MKKLRFSPFLASLLIVLSGATALSAAETHATNAPAATNVFATAHIPDAARDAVP